MSEELNVIVRFEVRHKTLVKIAKVDVVSWGELHDSKSFGGLEKYEIIKTQLC